MRVAGRRQGSGGQHTSDRDGRCRRPTTGLCYGCYEQARCVRLIYLYHLALLSLSRLQCHMQRHMQHAYIILLRVVQTT
jgi:hypothetical protein